MYAAGLEWNGFRVTSVGDGSTAFAQAVSLEPQMVTDLHVPGLNGLELCRRLKMTASTAMIPVIGVTGAARANDVELARAAGFDRMLIKPAPRTNCATPSMSCSRGARVRAAPPRRPPSAPRSSAPIRRAWRFRAAWSSAAPPLSPARRCRCRAPSVPPPWPGTKRKRWRAFNSITSRPARRAAGRTISITSGAASCGFGDPGAHGDRQRQLGLLRRRPSGGQVRRPCLS